MKKKVKDELMNALDKVACGLFIICLKDGQVWTYLGGEDESITIGDAMKLLGYMRLLEKSLIDKVEKMRKEVV